MPVCVSEIWGQQMGSVWEECHLVSESLRQRPRAGPLLTRAGGQQLESTSIAHCERLFVWPIESLSSSSSSFSKLASFELAQLVNSLRRNNTGLLSISRELAVRASRLLVMYVCLCALQTVEEKPRRAQGACLLCALWAISNWISGGGCQGKTLATHAVTLQRTLSRSRESRSPSAWSKFQELSRYHRRTVLAIPYDHRSRNPKARERTDLRAFSHLLQVATCIAAQNSQLIVVATLERAIEREAKAAYRFGGSLS